ncbi:hypothetical protein PQ465_09195 [Sphingobacterium oryzagri]|uniref:Uncharacterized protein n=1 Tax=Sphingobacterium oryzagri TaxID=3025669 RepID=A0ABY7WLS0_9SPHI|nr:hypothetical protein [Sphingobacterium sp. KACC 22765]WDF70533.1 hypothetical protein PQ465_09195 [Sphingobacterium sp. KACC 22765]
MLNIGFRIQPKTERYFQIIIDDLIANEELNLHLRNNGSTDYNPSIDFKFVVMEKYLSVENEFTLRESLVLNSFFFLKGFTQSDDEAFGIDKNNVLMENIPVVYQPLKPIKLVRNAKRHQVY